jgi:CheY-like chemotaxis protein
MLERLHGSDEGLAGKTVLLVDDDARNIFALSSVLERRAMRVLTATTGSAAIALLDANLGAGHCLDGYMMQEMDGYETIRLIRGNPLFGRLVALTAKTMMGDRE